MLCKLDTSFGGIINPNEVAKARIDVLVYFGNQFDVLLFPKCTYVFLR